MAKIKKKNTFSSQIIPLITMPYPLHTNTQLVISNSVINLNPFKPNGTSHTDQLSQSISVLSVFGGIFFIFIKILIEQNWVNRIGLLGLGK